MLIGASTESSLPGSQFHCRRWNVSNTVITFMADHWTATPCSTGPSCTWEASMVGAWVYGPDYERTGEEIFATGAGANKGSYRSRLRKDTGSY